MVCSHCPTVRPIKNGLQRKCGCDHTAQRWTPTQILIEFWAQLVPLSICVGQCEGTITDRNSGTRHLQLVVLFQTLVSMLEKSRDYVSFLQKKLDKYLLGQGDQALGK